MKYQAKNLARQTHDRKLSIKSNTSENMYIEELEDDTSGEKNFTDEDEDSATSNLTITIFISLHFACSKKNVSFKWARMDTNYLQFEVLFIQTSHY